MLATSVGRVKLFLSKLEITLNASYNFFRQSPMFYRLHPAFMPPSCRHRFFRHYFAAIPKYYNVTLGNQCVVFASADARGAPRYNKHSCLFGRNNDLTLVVSPFNSVAVTAVGASGIDYSHVRAAIPEPALN